MQKEQRIISDLENEREAIARTVQMYVDGGKSGRSEDMKPAFHPDATIYGHIGPELFGGPIQLLFDWNDKNGPATELESRIESIDMQDSIATVRLELDHWTGHKFTDMFTLLKIDGEWNILSKVFYLHPEIKEFSPYWLSFFAGFRRCLSLRVAKQIMRLSPTIALLIVAILASSITQKVAKTVSAQEELPAAPSPYLFIWTADADEKDSDFLAVIDARPDSTTYGQVLNTLLVGARATYPHHTEYELSTPTLFANGWAAGQTFIIDLSNPTKPKLSGRFKDGGAYSFPHSFARLPNGNVLATFQVRRKGYEPPGGLVELNPRGKVLRTSSADVPGFDKKLLWPYSLTVLPKIDRVITTSTEMGLPKWALPKSHDAPTHEHTLTDTHHIQIWSLKDLRLLATVPLPPSPMGKAQLNPAEPRVLPDGTRTLIPSTAACIEWLAWKQQNRWQSLYMRFLVWGRNLSVRFRW